MIRALFCTLILTIPVYGSALPFLDSTVTVYTPGSGGSGTVIKQDKEILILTAEHVIRSCFTMKTTEYRTVTGYVRTTSPVIIPVTIEVERGKSLVTVEAAPVWVDAKRDLALLRPKCTKLLVPAHLWLDTRIARGQDVWYCGYGGGLRGNLQKSIVNRLDNEWLTVNGGGWYGHSGSGVFVKKGKNYGLVGVLVALHDRTNARSPVLAVPAADIQTFLKAYQNRGKACGCY